MAERTYTAHSGHPTTGQLALLTPTAVNTLTTLMQLHAPQDGPPLRIVEWKVDFNGSQINQAVECDLVETGQVGATSITPFVAPYTQVGSGGIASGATSLPVGGHAGWPSSGDFLAKIWNEVILITAGQGTNTWTVTRGVNGVTTSVTIPAGTPILPVGGVPTGDIMASNIGGEFPSAVARQLYYDVVNGYASSGFWTGATPAEGSIGSGSERILDSQLIQPTNNWVHPWPLAREPEVQPGNFVRVRVSVPQTPIPACSAYVTWAE